MIKRTWVECRLEGSQSIILEHVQERLRDPTQFIERAELTCKISVLSFRHCPDLGKGSSHSYAGDLPGDLSVNSGEKERGWQTQLRENVPEPVDDEHYAKNGERSGLADARGVAGRKVLSGGLVRVGSFPFSLIP